MVEVLYVKDESLDPDRKRAFIKKAVRIFQKELGTLSERLRLVFQHVGPEDGKFDMVIWRKSKTGETNPR